MKQQDRSDATIVAVSVDDRAHLDSMVARVAATDGRRIDFTMLSDPGHRVIDRYGLLNPTGQGLPHPTTYLIDKTGTVRWKFTEVNYKIRPNNTMIMEALGRIH